MFRAVAVEHAEPTLGYIISRILVAGGNDTWQRAPAPQIDLGPTRHIQRLAQGFGH